ncbi:type I-G CRISPR-associated RAMP protein Csb1/Cas7g [Streptomyces nigrescens]|uniref:type I-G CRISPR-associated RAMP protein Csb1/Cas7g n=1 Tax=Streptomyces nigrescens TaxID=1920 RepID=UPI0036FC6896
MRDVYERLLAAANLRSADGAVRIVAEYEPAGGPGASLFPPTVKVSGSDAAGYLRESRYVDGEQVEVVYLDQPQSQANRCEVALLDAVRRGELFVPHVEMRTEAQNIPVQVSNLEAPHRSRDAYFRDSLGAKGEAFDETPAGKALRDARAGDYSAFLRLVPSDLLYGVWDSHRKRRIAVKVARAYTSSIIGVAPLVGVRAAGRVDQLNLAGDTVQVTSEGWKELECAKAPKGAKTARMSEIGHGMIPPSESIGGVSVASVQRTATVSMAQLASLRFGTMSEELTAASRALLAAMALAGDRLAFAAPALRLRSGCDLLMVSERMEWVGRGRDGLPLAEPLELGGPQEALALFEFALKQAVTAGLEWPDEPLVVQPNASLQKAIEKSFQVDGIGEAEGE